MSTDLWFPLALTIVVTILSLAVLLLVCMVYLEFRKEKQSGS